MADFPAEGNDHNDEQNNDSDVSSDHYPNQAHFAFQLVILRKLKSL